MLNGMHLIAGEWVDAPEHFTNAPVSGEARRFAMGNPDLVDRAARAAEAAFAACAATSRAARAAFLRRIAEEIDARGDEITAIGSAETGLPGARLEGERGRTTGQLRMFADHIEKGDYLDSRHDPALPDRSPAPRPDLRLMQRPIGPVAVFGASNFPLAFSTAGGDTASALAAGCPVVVKGHPSHPGTGEIVGQAIAAAAAATDMPAGVFSLVQGGDVAIGQSLVRHPAIRAVGFTGSLGAGRALFDLCAARPEPIPFFGEMGSVNPVFVLPGAAAARAGEIGKGWAGSVTLGVGQFCTKPGLLFVEDGPGAEALIEAARGALAEASAQTMLNEGIAGAFREGAAGFAARPALETCVAGRADGREGAPQLYAVSGGDFLSDPGLAEEVFGPLGLVVRASGAEQLRALAEGLDGQLTATLHLDESDHGAAASLLPILERKAGRLIANGFPTGVEVCDAMVHGGPYPATTNPSTTSVGTMAIRRFLRPVCYQDIPEALLPADLR